MITITKGSPDVLIEHCNRAHVGEQVVALDDTLRAKVLIDVQQLLDEALRTLSVAYRALDPGEDPRSGEGLEHDRIFVGAVGMMDSPRLEGSVLGWPRAELSRLLAELQAT